MNDEDEDDDDDDDKTLDLQMQDWRSTSSARCSGCAPLPRLESQS